MVRTTVKGIAYEIIESKSDLPPDRKMGDEAFLLVPGYSASRFNWSDEFVDGLSSERAVVLIDNRGMGGSEKLVKGNDYSVATFAQDVLLTMESLPFQRYHLIGHSLGGCIALEAAVLAKPRLLASLTLMSSTAGGPSYTAPARELLLQLATVPGDTPWEKAMSIWSVCLGAEALEKHKAEIEHQFTRSSAYPISSITLGTQLRAYQSFNRSGETLNFDHPTLIIHGADDRITPHENSMRLAEVVYLAKLCIQEGVEHMPFLEAKSECLKLISAMVAGTRV